MNPELQALLLVQDDDAIIRTIEDRLAALAPRQAALDAAQRRATEELARSEGALMREEAKYRTLEARISEHRQRHERNVEILNNAQKLKEATAAAAQVEAARRVLAEEESELLTVTRRLTDLRTATATHREALSQLTAEQATARAHMGEERAAIERELAEARSKRDSAATGVGRALLSKYDRVHARRRSAVVFSLHEDYSCGACDTAIPLQRRLPMSTGQVIEPCEACGVLLYYRVDAGASEGRTASE